MHNLPASRLVKPAIVLGAALLFGSQAYADAASSNDYDRHFRSPFKFVGNTAPAAPAPKATPAEKPAKQQQAAAASDDSLFPPAGKPGECWTRVLVSPQIETVQERILLKEESFELTEVPAVFEAVEERVMIRAASTRQEVVPATFKEVEERLVKTPAYTRKIPVPAVYDTATEQVMVKPARSYWKKGSGSLQKIDGETGEIMCYVTDPAVYETVKRTVIKTPATVREETIPAVYETVKRTVVDQPAQVKTIDVPAEYKTIKVQKVTAPARVERRVIPAEYATVSRQVSRGQSHMEWRRILCATNVTSDVIADLQNALNAAGHQVGAVDGNYGESTQRAVAAYQRAKGLAQGGLTYETLESLGVRLSR